MTRAQPPSRAVTWLIWAIGGAAAVQMVSNPFVLTVMIASTAVTAMTLRRPGAIGHAWPKLLSVGAVFMLIGVVLTTLTTHGLGQTIVHVPSITLPRVLGSLELGGSIEREVLLQATSTGLAIVTLFAVFGAANAVMSHHQLVRSLPRRFRHLGVVLAVGLAFIPSILTTTHAVREADLARTGGQRVRRGRVTRSIVTVLEQALDRAIALGETMDARGFGRRVPGDEDRLLTGLMVGALAAWGLSGLAVIGRRPVATLATLLIGFALLTLAVVVARPTRRRRNPARDRSLLEPWSWFDALIIGSGLAAPISIWLIKRWHLPGHNTTRWAANPLHWPRLHPLVALAAALLALPALYAIGLRPSAARPADERSP